MTADPEWKQFEKLAYKIQKIKYANANIEFDRKIRDVITKRLRQVDISISLLGNGQQKLIVVECKKYSNKTINQPNVEQFVSFVKSVGAHKGILIASNGYSKSAKIYADAMDIDLFNLEEANEIEWNEFIKEITHPVIKKRHFISDVEIISNNTLYEFNKTEILKGKSHYELYTYENGSYISMKEFRDKHPRKDFDHFHNMTNLHDYLVEWVDEQTSTKLHDSKSEEYDKIREEVYKETGQNSFLSLLVHIFTEDIWAIEDDPETKLTWASKVFILGKNPETGKIIPPSRFLKIGDDYFPINQMSLNYRIDISIGRYRGNEELNEFDLTHGMVYLDVLEDKREFYFLSDISDTDSN